MALESPDVDVAVIGAGLAGLAAADRVRSRGGTVAVIEARDQVGGRTLTSKLGGTPVDLGAEWFGTHHRHVMALVRRFGLHAERSGQLANRVRWRLPLTEVDGRLPPRGVRWDLARALWAARGLARSVDPREPWFSPGARSLDRFSFAGWLRRRDTGAAAHSLLASLVGALASAPIEDVSLLQVLWWVSRGGGPLRTITTTFQAHLREGTQALCRGLADSLEGSKLLGRSVTTIEQADDVVVSTSTENVKARRAIVTGAPASSSQIEFDPPLAAAQAELSTLRTDPGTKIVARLPRGALPVHHTVLGRRRLWAAWRHDDRLTGFAPPPDSDAPDAALADDLAECFDVSAPELEEVHVHRWAQDPGIPGCDISFAPGQITSLGPALRRPHDRVHFAGAERSTWPNNMEGAIESGTEVADRVLADLGR